MMRYLILPIAALAQIGSTPTAASSGDENVLGANGNSGLPLSPGRKDKRSTISTSRSWIVRSNTRAP